MDERYAPPPSMRRTAPRALVSDVAIGVGLAAATGALAYALMRGRDPDGLTHRPADDAPGRTARRRRFGDMAVTGRTVTIHRPRAEIYAFWRDFANLARFMENVKAVRTEGDVSSWTIAAPAGRSVTVRSRIAQDRENEMISWRSTDESDIRTEGKVTFRDAPGDRGTEVEAIIAYAPPGGELGRLVARMFQTEPAIQARRDLKRLKMLLETGEIATNANRPEA